MPESDERAAFGGEAAGATEQRAPAGPLRHAWFAGLLEGRRGDDARLEAAVEKLNEIGLLHVELELDGGRFNILADERVVPGTRFEKGELDALVTALGELVACAADPAAVESTLRCVEVYADGVIETLFAPRDAQVTCVSHVRPVEAADLAASPFATEEPLLTGIGRRRAALLAALLVLVFGLLAWRSGWVDRVWSAGAEELVVDAGPFEGLLAVEVTSRLGNYRIVLTRGANYPLDPAGSEVLLAAADTTLRHAAVARVVEGGEVFVRLVDDEGHVLAAITTRLAKLLVGPHERVEVRLHGRLAARGVALALTSGKDD